MTWKSKAKWDGSSPESNLCIHPLINIKSNHLYSIFLSLGPLAYSGSTFCCPMIIQQCWRTRRSGLLDGRNNSCSDRKKCKGVQWSQNPYHEKMQIRPINPTSKWIRRHRDWAKEKKVRHNCDDCFLCNAKLTELGASEFVQVNVKKVNKNKLFAKRYPAASRQLTSHREVEARPPIVAWTFMHCNILQWLYMCVLFAIRMYALQPFYRVGMQPSGSSPL